MNNETTEEFVSFVCVRELVSHYYFSYRSYAFVSWCRYNDTKIYRKHYWLVVRQNYDHTNNFTNPVDYRNNLCYFYSSF